MAKLRVLTERPPEAAGTEAAQIEALRDFLFRVTEELRHVLLHLDERNFSPGVELGGKVGDSLSLQELLLSGGITGDGWYLGPEDGGLALRFGETEILLSDRVDADLRRPSAFDFSTLGDGYFRETLEGEAPETARYNVTRDGQGRIVKITDASDGFETAVIWE